MGVPTLPPALEQACHEIARRGGRALLVGGCVRDALLGVPVKDLDVEVHGLPMSDLRAVLATCGPVNEVGRSFGVLKVRVGDGEIDVSLPRRDSKAGPGHRGIAVLTDPFLGIAEAARRRDLTINAMAYDPLTGEFLDPFDGRGDLQRRLLRAVDAQTFGEDPLRALRVAQFAARFEFDVSPETEQLCAAAPLAELPAERIRGEVEKLLLRGRCPSRGWNLAHRLGLWRQVLPEWDTTAPARLDEIAREARGSDPERLGVVLACTLTATTAPALLDRLQIHRWQGFALRARVLALVAAAGQTGAAPSDLPLSDEDLRRLAETVPIPDFALLIGRPELPTRAAALGVHHGPLPHLLAGRELAALGIPPGPAMGALLAELRELQIRGQISSSEEARAWARTRAG